jgi:hypothetical protein
VVAQRLAAQANVCGLINPLQCGSVPGKSAADAALTLTTHVESLQRFKHKVSTLFLDIKGGFDNVSANILMAHLRMKGVSPYLIAWIGSFLRERTCRLVFQGAPHTFRPVQVGVPQGSPISPLLFVIYVSSLHVDIPRVLTISYVDDFALTAASQSWEENAVILRNAYTEIRSKATPRGVSFSIPKTELIHWRTPRDTSQVSTAPVRLEGQPFSPTTRLRWLGFWFTPSPNGREHYSKRLGLANAAFSTIRRLSLHGMGLSPHLCHRLARSLLAPILLYGAALWFPPRSLLEPMKVFWNRVCRWVTNCFRSTNVSPLHREACLPPVACIARHLRRTAALRVLCSPPEYNPATARIPTAVPTYSEYRSPRMKIPKPKGTIPQHRPHQWDTPPETYRPGYRHSTLTALIASAVPVLGGVTTLPTYLPALDRNATALSGDRTHICATEKESAPCPSKGLERDAPGPRLLPLRALLETPPLHGPWKVHCRSPPPDEGRQELPGCPPVLGEP